MSDHASCTHDLSLLAVVHDNFKYLVVTIYTIEGLCKSMKISGISLMNHESHVGNKGRSKM